MKRLILIRRIPSRSNPNRFWVVRIFKDDDNGLLSWECGCPFFLFRNPFKEPCYHIKKTLNEYKLFLRGGEENEKNS